MFNHTKHTTQRPSGRASGARLGLVLTLGALAMYMTLAGQGTEALATSGTGSVHNVPFVDEAEPFAVFATDQVCSLMGQNQLDVHILGQDGGDSILHDGKSYWSFGDTFIDREPYNGIWEGLGADQQIPNSVATTSADTNASDCVSLTSKTDGQGTGTTLLPLNVSLGEQTVWPTGWIQPDPSETSIYFYYSSRRAPGAAALGVGLAKMSVANLSSVRIPRSGATCNSDEACLFWKETAVAGQGSCSEFTIGVAKPYRDGSMVYLFFGIDSSPAPGIGRVPYTEIEDWTAYEYWDGTTWVAQNPCVMTGLWDVQPLPRNGLTAGLNDFVSRYLVTYATGFLSQVAVRGTTQSAMPTPDQLTGPWTDERVVVSCPQFLQDVPAVQAPGHICYGGRQYAQFERGNGQVLYVGYSNTESYRVYLQEVVVGTPVYQWEDAAGHTAYRRQDDSPGGSYKMKGIAFYAYYDASGCTDPAMQTIYERYDIAPIKEVYDSAAERRLYVPAPVQVPAGFVDNGIRFCASRTVPPGLEPQLAPISRWNLGSDLETHVYSALDLGTSHDFSYGGVAFYAKIANYRVSEANFLPPSVGDKFQVELRQGNEFATARLTDASFARIGATQPLKVHACVLEIPLICGDLDTGLIPQDLRIAASGLHPSSPKVAAMLLTVQQGSVPVFSGIAGLRFSDLEPNTGYELHVCSPLCSEDPDRVVYEVSSDANGVVQWGGPFAPASAPRLRILSADVPLFAGLGFERDGQVTLSDILVIAASFGASFQDANWYQKEPYDLSGDGQVALGDDILRAAASFGINGWPPFGMVGLAKGQLISFFVAARDENGDTLTYSAQDLPAGSCFNVTPCAEREFRWTPDDLQQGSYFVKFDVEDDGPLSGKQLTIGISVP